MNLFLRFSLNVVNNIVIFFWLVKKIHCCSTCLYVRLSVCSFSFAMRTQRYRFIFLLEEKLRETIETKHLAVLTLINQLQNSVPF